MQTLPTQDSKPLQALPSSQSKCTSQQGGEGRGVPGEHNPLWQVSAPLQTSPSAQEVPSGSRLARQAPAPLQVSGLSQLVSVDDPHAVPAPVGGLVQPTPGTQMFCVHKLPSAQLGGGPPTHTVAEQVSPVVQTSPSSQDAVFGVWKHPVTGWQKSSVHTLESSQFSGAPARQALPTHDSKPSHTSPLLHSESSVQQAGTGVPGAQTPLWQVSAPLQKTPSAQDEPSSS